MQRIRTAHEKDKNPDAGTQALSIGVSSRSFRQVYGSLTTFSQNA